jgi:hypothetical protein
MLFELHAVREAITVRAGVGLIYTEQLRVQGSLALSVRLPELRAI